MAKSLMCQALALQPPGNVKAIASFHISQSSHRSPLAKIGDGNLSL